MIHDKFCIYSFFARIAVISPPTKPPLAYKPRLKPNILSLKFKVLIIIMGIRKTGIFA